MASKSGLRVILGTANIGDSTATPNAHYDKPEDVLKFLDTFYSRGYRILDTAESYSPGAPGTSEARLGIAKAAERFEIDTKAKAGSPGCHSKEKVEQSIDNSLAALKTSKINVWYLHGPDRTTPFEETLEAVNKVYGAGKFSRFGISNFSPDEVEKVVQICEQKGYIKPSVYQGPYNAIARGGEKDLFPILRKHNISFDAYSPSAAGFFTGNYKKPREGGRYDPSHFLGAAYSKSYVKPAFEAAAETARALAEKHDISGHAAAVRWTAFHSELKGELGDGIILGASNIDQLTSNLDIIEAGPLPEEVAKALGDVYSQGSPEDEVAYHW